MRVIVKAEFHAADWHVADGVAGYCWEAIRPVAVVLLQHGYGEYACRYYYGHSRLIQRLLELNISVYAFDMHGHGGSSGELGATDVRKVVSAHVSARQKLEEKHLPIYLIGHSLGGLVTAGSVARYPACVEGMVLLSPAIVKPVTYIGDSILIALSHVLASCPVTPMSKPDGLSRAPYQVESFLSDRYCFAKPVRGLLGLTAVSVSNGCWRAASGWQAPTLLLHGTDDTYTSYATSSALFKVLAAKHKEIRLYEGFRHELLNDDGECEVIDKLIGWVLDRISLRLMESALERAIQPS